MSECSTCLDRRLVGGFLPVSCPSCSAVPSAKDARIAELESALTEACDIADENLVDKIQDHPTTIRERDRVTQLRAISRRRTT